MSVASLLARGRAAAERLMVDTCTIRRRTGESTGPGGVVTPTYEVLYGPGVAPHHGKCRVQQSALGGSASSTDVGEDYTLLLALTVQLPMSLVGLQSEDEITVDTSVHDADLPGRVFFVKDLAHKSHATARRVGVVERS